MRLLNVHTLKFQEFFEPYLPPYCILSHRWGENEPTYKQFRKGIDLSGPGYQKILDFCSFVKGRKIWGEPSELETPFDWMWVDTICIDKRSSAELSEAINAMFKWYGMSRDCIVYLNDVDGTQLPDHALAVRLRHSSWFSRGWTLQELLAPNCCVFVDKSWNIIGHICMGCEGDMATCRSTDPTYGRSLSSIVSKITSIPRECLKTPTVTPPYQNISIAQRMSWASQRSTTRIEDMAYCLLGLFGINMPLLYGEGNMAFIRLQEEIIKRNSDQSLFAWYSSGTPYAHPGADRLGILASSPQDFAEAGSIRLITKAASNDTTHELTNKGLQIEARAIRTSCADLNPHRVQPNRELALLLLNCYDDRLENNAGIRSEEMLPCVMPVVRETDQYSRMHLMRDDVSPIYKLVGKKNETVLGKEHKRSTSRTVIKRTFWKEEIAKDQLSKEQFTELQFTKQRFTIDAFDSFYYV